MVFSRLVQVFYEYIANYPFKTIMLYIISVPLFAQFEI